MSSLAAPTAKVLIVEDEFLVALQLEDILTEAGHCVVGIVPDSAAARHLPEPPQVALVDLNLRDGPSGPDIAAQLSRRYGTMIVYVTANPSQIVEPAPTAIGFVHKPFSPQAILGAVAVALGADDGQGDSAFAHRYPPFRSSSSGVEA